MTAPDSAPLHPPLVFSGMQPTGKLHLGNYLGAIRNWLKLQDQHHCLYCVVDLHAMTMPFEPAELALSTRTVAAAYFAAGVDPSRAIVFNQSQVREHVELAWIFNCVARLGWLDRMTQFKDKAGKNSERHSVGLYAYPVLMAADILAYKGTLVPVGDDQKQHVELARDIAARFNNEFGATDFFPLPEPMIQGPAKRIMSLRDGTTKMSKSDPSDLSRINLTDDADQIANKIKRAKTDPHPLPDDVGGLSGRFEAENLLSIFAALSDRSLDSVTAEFAGKQFSELKGALTDLTVAVLGPINAEMRRYMADPAEIDRHLAKGANAARAKAAPILRDVRRIVGLVDS
jgi:tryptophanyl-tRNA synthetase